MANPPSAPPQRSEAPRLQSSGRLLRGAGDIGLGHGGGGAGPGGGAAAAGRDRRARAAARGRRGAHPAAVPAVPGADASTGDSRRGAERLHVVLDPVAVLAQLGHGAGTLPLSRPFGLDGRGARHPSGRCGIAAHRFLELIGAPGTKSLAPGSLCQ